jgi:cold shock CspA family protein
MTVRIGTVTEFDDPRGIGVVTDDAGTEFPFHCTAIADGTRQIAVGTSVRFVGRPGRLGRWEATDIAPATPASTT